MRDERPADLWLGQNENLSIDIRNIVDTHDLRSGRTGRLMGPAVTDSDVFELLRRTLNMNSHRAGEQVEILKMKIPTADNLQPHKKRERNDHETLANTVLVVGFGASHRVPADQ
jgi:hypothetical protein